MKKRIKRCILLVLMLVMGIITFPANEVFSKQFWLWLTILLFITICFANIFLKEEQFQLFDMINIENFKKAPIFGVLVIPMSISTVALIITAVKDFLK